MNKIFAGFPSFPGTPEIAPTIEQPPKKPLKQFSSQWLGLSLYKKSLQQQTEAWNFVKKTNSLVVLGQEHPSVITLGKRSIFENEVKVTPEELLKANIEWAKTDRGGMATIHTPGQLVIYPVFPIREINISIRHFIVLMEQTTKELLENYGIKIQKKENDPGLYTEFGKIAYFGFRIDRGITRHGISINVNNDLSLFSFIRSCGKDVDTFDKIKHYKNLETIEVFNTWLELLESNLLDLKDHLA